MRAADEHGREDRFLDALPEAGLELRVGDLLALEVLHEHVVVRLGGGLEELIPPARHLVGHPVGDRRLDLLAAVERERLPVDQVDVAREVVGRADRELERRDLVAEGRPERVERRGRVGVLLVALVDEEARRGPGRPPERDRLLEARLDAARRVHDEDRAVGGLEAGDHLGDEVEVARRVDDRHARAVGLERRDREAQGLAALLLLGLEVEVGGAILDLADAADRAGLEQELLTERRLAGACVAGEDDAPNVGEVDALDGHGATSRPRGGEGVAADLGRQ